MHKGLGVSGHTRWWEGFLLWAGLKLVRLSWQIREQKVPNRMRLGGHVAH